MNEKCNCGRDVRYLDKVGGKMVGSCNKYEVCPTYDEVTGAYKELESKYNRLLSAAEDVITFREDSIFYNEAVRSIQSLMEEWYDHT